MAAKEAAPPPLLMDVAFVLFVLTALTDMLDGMIARRYKLVTTFGRIADPFADKVLVIGSFIFLMGFRNAYLSAWVVVVIISREFLVSGLRGYIEGQGKKFSATMWGKVKVCSQYTIIGWLIFFLAHFGDNAAAVVLTKISVVAVAILTAISGVTYLLKAIRMLCGDETS